MEVVCKKAFKNMKVGQITTFTPRDDVDLQAIGRSHRSFSGYPIPIGCVYLIDDFLTDFYSVNSIVPQFINCFVFYEDFEDHFCTLKEYRKLKLKKINNI